MQLKMKYKRFLSLLMALAMMLSLLPMQVFATGGGQTGEIPADSTDELTELSFSAVAKVGNTEYDDIQAAIQAAAPAGTVELLADVTVEKWVMITETLSIGSGQLITVDEINGLTINGNNHTLTIQDIESAGNGARLFYDATNLNIKDLTIKYEGAAANLGGIGLTSGTISNVTFDGGVYGVLPGTGEVTITGCTFKTNGTSVYFEEDRDDLAVTGCNFENPDTANVILLRGDVEFTNNTIVSGRTVNVVSGSPVVTGNDFNDVRFKVYNDATATISNNTINDLAFNDGSPVQSTFADDNTLSESAQTALEAVTPAPTYVAKIGDTEYASLEAAFTEAVEGETITLLANATPALTSQRAITSAAVIDLGGKTLTLTEDDLYFGTTTFKNGTIVVDPSVRPSTAVFWMFANQILTFDNVKLIATGVTGTYLIGLDGNNSDLNLLNGSEILVENTTALDLDIICVNASTGNDIVIDNSKVNVINLDGRVFFRGNYTVKGNSDIDLSGITKAGFRIEAGQTLSIEDTATVDIVGEPRDGGIHLTDLTATYTKADTATVNATVTAPVLPDVAQIGETNYKSLAEAVEEAKSGDEIVLLADVTEDVTLPAGVTLNGNGKQVGVITAAGEITFKGHTKASNFSVQYTNTTINIGEGACLEITGTGRMVIGHGCTFNITGTITEAKTANTAELTPSLIMPGASFTGAGVDFNVTNAYIKVPSSYCSSSKTASGTFDFDIINSVWESAGKLAFESQSTAATVNFDLKDSVLTTGSHLVFGVSRGEVVIDNSNVNVGTSRQIENQSTMTVKNGSVVNGAVAISSNAKNPGTLIVDNATYAVTGEFSGSDLGTGTLIVKKGATFSAGSITKANIVVDATGMAVGDIVNVNADLSALTGTLSVINNDTLAAEIVDKKIVLAEYALSGSGTETDPFIINDLKALKWFRDNVNSGISYDNQYVKLTADIDLEGEEWTPIGYMGKTFKGTFDGGNNTISNLKITKELANTAANNGIGLFGRTDDKATIKNLTIENVDITGSLYVGAVVGYGYTGKAVENVTVKGDITIDAWWYAGVIGGNGYMNLVNDCHVIGDDGSYVKGNEGSYIGGIWGFRGEGANKITNCTVTNIDIIGVDRVGGICGIGHYGNTISGCEAENVTITATDPEATTVGLIVGACQGTASQPTVFEDNTLTDTTAQISNGDDTYTAVTGLYGTNIDGMVPVTNIVAEVDGVPYTTLQAAIDAVRDGQTIKLLKDVEQQDGVIITDKKLTLDLNDKTFTVTEGASTNNRNIKVNGSSVVTIKNGTMVAKGDYSSGAYGTVRTEGTANVTLTDLELYNYRGNGLNIKALGGTTVTMTDVEVYAQYGGGIESAGGTIELNNVTVEQKGMYTAPYNSMAISVNGGGKVTVNSGTYSTECITAEDANNQGTSHGPWVVGVLNSGGTLIINGGTFSNDNYGEDALATAARGAVLADTGAVVEIYGGTFNALKGIIDIQNNLGLLDKNPGVTISGGTFSADPTVAAYNHLIKIAEGYAVKENGDGTYGIKAANEAWILRNNVPKFYPTLADAIADAEDGETVILAANVTVDSRITIDKNITISDYGALTVSFTGNSGITLAKDTKVILDNFNMDISGVNVQTGNNIFVVNQGAELTMNKINLTGSDYTTKWAVICVNGEDSTLNLIDSTVTLSNELGSKGGFVKDSSGVGNYANVNITNSKLTLTDVKRGFTGCKVTMDGVNLTITGGEHGINGAELSVTDSTLNISGGTGRALTLNKFDASIVDSTLNFSDMGEGEIRMKTANTLTLTDTTLNKCDIYADVTTGAKVNDQEVTGTEDNMATVVATADGVNVTNPNWAVQVTNGTAISGRYLALADAVAAVQNGETVVLIKDIELAESVTVAKDQTVVLDLNGKNITGTDTTSKNFGLINNNGTLTIKDSVGGGKMTVTATVNSGWNRYSAVISNNPGGTLVVNGGTIEHLGGTDMAYGIDSLTNGGIGDVSVTINDGTVKSTYRAIRQFLNSDSKQNVLTINGGTIEGTNKAIFFHDPSTKANNGTLTVVEDAVLKGDVYLFVTAGSTEWPVTVSIDAAALNGDSQITSKNIPEQYLVQQTNGTWGKVHNPAYGMVAVIVDAYYATLPEAIEAAQAGETITLLADVELTDTLTIAKSITLDGNDHKLTPADASETYNSAIMAGDSGWGDDHGETITLKGIVFEGWKTNYGVVRAQGVTLNVEGCEFNENAVSNDAYGVLSLNFTDATVANSKFSENTSRAIDINYNGDDSNAVVTIDSCTFTGNNSTGAGIVVRNDGEKLVVKNSIFTGNTVNTAGNAAVLYAGWGTNDEVTGCTFENNTVTTSHTTTKRFASAIFCDGCTVNGNAFTNNTATRNSETITTTVAVGAYYGAADIGENYWGGEAPVPGVDYTIEYSNKPVAVEDYYTNAERTNLESVSYVAKVGKYSYTTLAAAFEAAQAGDTVTILAGNYTGDVNVNKAITVVGATDDEGNNLVNITGKLNVTADGATVKNLNVNNGSTTAGYINAEDVLVEGCSVVGGNGFRYCYTDGTVTFKDSTITGSTYGIHFDGSAGGNIVIDNCVITGWTSFASTIKKVTMTDTTFEEGNYNYVRFYQEEVVIDGCTFNENMAVDIAVNGAEVTVTDSTVENGSVEDLFEGTDILNSSIYVDDVKLVRVASIGNVYYKTFAEALEAAQAGDTITLYAPVVVNAGETLTLDKAVTITYTSDVAGEAMFTNRGTMNVEGATIVYTYAGAQDTAYTKGNYTISNSGNLTVESGSTIQVAAKDCPGKFSHALYAINGGNGSALTINGGKIFNDNNIAVRQFGAGSITVNGGQIEGLRAVWMQAPSSNADVAPEMSLTVNGGTLSANEIGESNGDKLAVYSYSYGNSMKNIAITINDGTINGDIALTGGSNKTVAETVTITGGSITDIYSYAGDEVAKQTIQVSGGTFGNDENVEKFLVEGCSLKASGGKYTVETAAVAIVAGDTYTSLQEAVNAAVNGETVYLQRNVTLSQQIKIPKGADITLDLKDKTVTGSFLAPNADLTVKNGSIVNTNSSVSALEINAGTLTLTGVNMDSARHAVRIDGAVTATINGGEYKSGQNIPEGTKITSHALNISGEANVTIENGTFVGPRGTIADSGAAVNVQSGATVTINGGDFSKGKNNTLASKGTLTITGGTFDQDPSTYVADGYRAAMTEDGKYVVSEIVYVAQVDETKFETLAKAVAVADGKTVQVLADVTLSETLTIEADKTVTLDLNGKTISGTCGTNQAHLFMVVNGATLTIKDSSTEQTGKITYAGNNSTGWIVDVEGALVLESGTLELTGTWNIGYAVDVRPNAWGTAYTAPTTFVMGGGKIVSSDGAVRVASSSSDIYSDVSASFTMNGGEIDAAWDGVFVQQSNAAWDVLSFTINGGTIKSGLNPVRFYGPAATSYVNGEDCVDIALNGGTLTYTGEDETLVWLIDEILRLGGGVTAEDFLKDSAVTASETFAKSNVAKGYQWKEGADDKYSLVKDEEPVELKEFLGTNITMGNELDVNFAFSADYVDSTGYAKIVRSYADDRADDVVTIKLSNCEVRSGAYIIKYSGLAAKEMCDELQVTVYDADNKQISVTHTDSMRAYIMRNIDKTTFSAEVRTLFVDMLNYGAAAQENFNYNTDDLANSELSEAQKAYGTQTNPSCTNNRSVTGNNTSAYAGTNFVLENKISMQFAVKTSDISGGSMEASFTNHNGQKVNVTVQAADATTSGNFTIFVIDEIVVADGRQDITCTFKDASGNVVVTVVDSMESYVARMGGSNEWLYAIMKFSDSAYQYLH